MLPIDTIPRISSIECQLMSHILMKELVFAKIPTDGTTFKYGRTRNIGEHFNIHFECITTVPFEIHILGLICQSSLLAIHYIEFTDKRLEFCQILTNNIKLQLSLLVRATDIRSF